MTQTLRLSTPLEGVEGPFASPEDFLARATAPVERTVRVFTAEDYPWVRVVVPETYATDLENVQRFRLRLGGAGDTVAPAVDLDPKLLSRATPEDVVDLFAGVPDMSCVNTVLISDGPSPYDAWFRQTSQNAAFASAAGATAQTISLFAPSLGPDLQTAFNYAWAHCFKHYVEDFFQLFEAAAALEAGGFYFRERARESLSENWALHCGECVLGDDEAFEEFSREAPLRAAILGDALERFMSRPDCGNPTIAARCLALRGPVREAALAELRVSLPARLDGGRLERASLLLLLRLGRGAPLVEFGGLRELDLSNAWLSDLSGLSALTQLETLNLSGTPIAARSLEFLALLPKLKWLDVSDTFLESRALDVIARAPALEYLNVSGTRMYPDKHPSYLRRLGGLKTFEMRGIDITDREVFEHLLPDCEIIV